MDRVSVRGECLAEERRCSHMWVFLYFTVFHAVCLEELRIESQLDHHPAETRQEAVDRYIFLVSSHVKLKAPVDQGYYTQGEEARRGPKRKICFFESGKSGRKRMKGIQWVRREGQNKS